MFQASLVASRHNAILDTFAKRLPAAGKPQKVVIPAVARKFVTIVNVLIKSGQNWSVHTLKKQLLVRKNSLSYSARPADLEVATHQTTSY